MSHLACQSVNLYLSAKINSSIFLPSHSLSLIINPMSPSYLYTHTSHVLSCHDIGVQDPYGYRARFFQKSMPQPGTRSKWSLNVEIQETKGHQLVFILTNCDSQHKNGFYQSPRTRNRCNFQFFMKQNRKRKRTKRSKAKRRHSASRAYDTGHDGSKATSKWQRVRITLHAGFTKISLSQQNKFRLCWQQRGRRAERTNVKYNWQVSSGNTGWAQRSAD